MKDEVEEPPLLPDHERADPQTRAVTESLAEPSVLDASALLIVLFGEPGAEEVADVIAEGAAISTVNFSEVATVLVRNQRDAESILRGVSEQVTVQPFTREDALTAADLALPTRGSGLSLGDRACLALAKRLSVPAVTADRAWVTLDLDIEVRVVRAT